MKRARRSAFGALGLGILAGVIGAAEAQTIANGPYYPTPSWDQTLPASKRFIVLANMSESAVLDRETGLVWERSPDILVSDWSSAYLTCTNKFLGNRKGWRLPTIQELQSLVDPSQVNPALPPGHPFGNVVIGVYWSSTTFPDIPNFAFSAQMSSGGIQGSLKTQSLNRWCVRGGMGEDPP